MTRFLAAFALFALPTVATGQTPAIYSGAEAIAASVKLCERGCTIVPRPKLVRVAATKQRAVAAPVSAAGMEALARQQLDALVAEID